MLFNGENRGGRACSGVSMRNSGNEACKSVRCRSKHNRKVRNSEEGTQLALVAGGGDGGRGGEWKSSSPSVVEG